MRADRLYIDLGLFFDFDMLMSEIVSLRVKILKREEDYLVIR